MAIKRFLINANEIDLKDIDDKAILRHFSPSRLEFLAEDGFVVVKEVELAALEARLKEAVSIITDYQEAHYDEIIGEWEMEQYFKTCLNRLEKALKG